MCIWCSWIIKQASEFTTTTLRTNTKLGIHFKSSPHQGEKRNYIFYCDPEMKELKSLSEMRNKRDAAGKAKWVAACYFSYKSACLVGFTGTRPQKNLIV